MQTRGRGLPRSGPVRRRPGVVSRAVVARLVHPLEAPRPRSRRAPSQALLVGGAVELNLFWVLVGTIGGFQVLGLIGVFVGPVVLALCGEMWREGIRDPAPLR